uniref:Kinesin-like protein n=1 Tax=Ditylenchus dipsaci TaxID=166011 RepID=A0A915ELP5_9BILA
MVCWTLTVVSCLPYLSYMLTKWTAQDSLRDTKAVFWSGMWSNCFNTTISFSVFFLTLDRIFCIKHPATYLRKQRNMLTTIEISLLSALCMYCGKNRFKSIQKAFQCVYPLDEQRVLLVDPEKFENNVLRQNRQHERQFAFDASFGPTSTHAEVHSKTTNSLVDYVVDGYNATVFAYGPTGTGKTYTMVGNRENPGLMSLLLASLYDKINPDEFTVYISFLEIYNEVIRDLLNPNTGNSLDLLEDEKGNVQVPGLSRVKAPNSNKLIKKSCPFAAGSERASQTQNKGQRLKEGASINRSLLALGNVINALSSGSKGRYVNYRTATYKTSKRQSGSSNYDETYNTLVYANRAKNITTRLVLNMKRPASADLPYTEAIQEIRKEATRRTNIPHASSSNQLSNGHQSSNHPQDHQQQSSSSTHYFQQSLNGNNRQFSSLFNSLKEQYLNNCEKQQRLRQRLLKANIECVM